MLPSAKAITTLRALYACELASIPATMSASALLTSWLVSARAVGEGVACAADLSRFRGTVGAKHFHDLRDDCDELIVVLPESAEQLDFVLCNKLQAITS